MIRSARPSPSIRTGLAKIEDDLPGLRRVRSGSCEFAQDGDRLPVAGLQRVVGFDRREVGAVDDRGRRFQVAQLPNSLGVIEICATAARRW